VRRRRRCACWARMLLVSALLCPAAAVYRPNYPLAAPVTWEMFGGAGNYSRDLGITLDWSRWDGYFLMNWTLTPSAGCAPRGSLAPVSRRSRLQLFALRSAQRRHFRVHLCCCLQRVGPQALAGCHPTVASSSHACPAPPATVARPSGRTPCEAAACSCVKRALWLAAVRGSPEGGRLACRRRHH